MLGKEMAQRVIWKTGRINLVLIDKPQCQKCVVMRLTAFSDGTVALGRMHESKGYIGVKGSDALWEGESQASAKGKEGRRQMEFERQQTGNLLIRVMDIFCIRTTGILLRRG